MLNLDGETGAPAAVTQVRGAMKVTQAAGSFATVAPSDSANLPGGPTMGLWINTSGNLKFIGENDSAPVTINSVPVGFLPFRVKQIFSTGTTAAGIVACY